MDMYITAAYYCPFEDEIIKLELEWFEKCRVSPPTGEVWQSMSTMNNGVVLYGDRIYSS